VAGVIVDTDYQQEMRTWRAMTPSRRGGTSWRSSMMERGLLRRERGAQPVR